MCNDPKCALNRQGVSHEDHESIESKPVTNPCLDGRCGLNRMGIMHESHESKEIPKQAEYQKSYSAEPTSSFNDQHKRTSSEHSNYTQSNSNYNEYSRKDSSSHNKLSREQIMQERAKREKQRIQQEAQEEVNRREREEQPKPRQQEKSRLFSKFKIKHGIPLSNQILQSHDPYIIFGLTKDTNCQEIKQKFKELSRTYNASTGSMNKTLQEKETLNKLQSRINVAYDSLRKRHCI